MYLHDAHSEASTFGLDGQPQGEIKLPGLGTVAVLADAGTTTETFYAFTGFTMPTTIYRYDVAGR